MKLYTKTGDKGKTSLIGGRTDKDNIRVESYGTVDELNSFVGLALAELSSFEESFDDIKTELVNIQHELFDCGSDLANITENQINKLKEEAVTYLEERIDVYIQEAPKLEKFILPGGSKASALMHTARTITRRAERQVVTLMKEDTINEVTLRYLNRLSDYLFAVARVINFRLGVPDVEYKRSAVVFREKK